jgi:hypothetical protein
MRVESSGTTKTVRIEFSFPHRAAGHPGRLSIDPVARACIAALLH